MIGAPGEDYERAHNYEMKVGDVIIAERQKYDYKKGFPVDSEYFRVVIGQHNTVSGPMFHMISEPDAEFPAFPWWAGFWQYTGGYRLWRKKR